MASRLAPAVALVIRAGVGGVEATMGHGRPKPTHLAYGEPNPVFPDSRCNIEVDRLSVLFPGLIRLRLRATCSGGYRMGLGAYRFLNLEPGSPDHDALTAMASQQSFELRWPEEDLAITYLVDDQHRETWLEALATALDAPASAVARELIGQGYPRSELASFPLRAQRAGKRRAMAQPEGGVPYFAARSGAIPRDGRARVSGVRLPPGHRAPLGAPTYWVTDEPVAAAHEVVASLTETYADTGLWPLLWDDDAEPETYASDEDTIASVESLDVTTWLTQEWEALAPHNLDAVRPFGASFPGLAERQASTPASSPPDASDRSGGTGATYVVLAACNRPADAISVIGGIAANISAAEVAAVVRSYEERFGAVLIRAAVREIELAITRPPSDRDQALRLAAELWAFAQWSDGAVAGSVAAAA